MAGPVPLTMPSELSSSTIAAALPTVSPSLVPASSQLRSLFPFRSAGVDRRQMAIAALCGAATLACVCGAAIVRRRKALDRQRGMARGAGGGGGAEMDANRDAGSTRASLSSGLGLPSLFIFIFFSFIFIWFFYSSFLCSLFTEPPPVMHLRLSVLQPPYLSFPLSLF